MSSFLLFTKHFLRLQPINSNKCYKLLNKWSPLSVFDNCVAKRTLYSTEFLGIEKYLEVRQRIGAQFREMKDKFFERMTEYTDSETNMIFTEDLKNVVFLVDNNESELNLMTNMLKKFNTQNKSLRFGTFVFGPQVMRLIHHLGNSDLAVQLIKDPQMEGFFNQLSSVTLVLDLLFIQEKYEELLDLFVYIQNNISLETKHPRDCVLLVIASCYKLNTSQSFETALEVLKNAREAGAQVTRKTICLFAALALNQNQPNIALEVLSIASQTNYITVRNLRIWALTDLKRFDDVLTVLQIMLSNDTPESGRELILEETLNRVKVAINSTDDKELRTKFSQIEKGLIEGNHVQEKSLDSLLLTPVTPFVNRQNFGFRNQNQNRNFRPFPVRQNYNINASKERRGLRDPEMD